MFENENSKKVCNSGNSPQKLQIKSIMLQIVLLLFPKNITQSCAQAHSFQLASLSGQAQSYLRLSPGLSSVQLSSAQLMAWSQALHITTGHPFSCLGITSIDLFDPQLWNTITKPKPQHDMYMMCYQQNFDLATCSHKCNDSPFLSRHKV